MFWQLLAKTQHTQSTATSPFSNVPLDCPLCGLGNQRYHLHDSHSTAAIKKYEALWKLTPEERSAAEALWNATNFANRIAVPRKRDPKTTELRISEPHSSRLSMRLATLAAPLDDLELPELPGGLDDDTPEETEYRGEYKMEGPAIIAAIPLLHTQDLDPSDLALEAALGFQSYVDMPPSSGEAAVASSPMASQSAGVNLVPVAESEMGRGTDVKLNGWGLTSLASIIWCVLTFRLLLNPGRAPPAPCLQVLRVLPNGFAEVEKYKHS
ncbi:hypothetical protein DFH09DRAFT_1094098 [Mycena vulgaris]|nr:hypothetical protein DFH09DRAFT_1094098 [Mycena vulgaris]